MKSIPPVILFLAIALTLAWVMTLARDMIEFAQDRRRVAASSVVVLSLATALAWSWFWAVLPDVLVACECSGVVRDAFRRAGHEAWSCDLEGVEPAGEWPNYHLYGDALWFLEPGRWDLLIAHPPCRYLSNSGVLRLYKGGKKRNGRDMERWRNMRLGAEFFEKLLCAPVPRICIENPVMHRHAKAHINVEHTQTIQPWQFGEDASKRTCLWLKGLPKLLPTNIIRKARYANQTPSGQNRLGPSDTRSAERAVTYQGIADAMAAQWGGVVWFAAREVQP